MGGSGGGGFFYESKTPEDITKRIREEEQKSKDDAFETDVAGLMKDLLATVNDRDTETLQGHLTTIKDALDLGIDGSIDLKYGGSVSKHTYVDGLSDVDSLAILNKSELVNLSPDEVKKYFYDRLKERLPDSDITIGKLAITIKFASGFEVQIVPAVKNDKGIQIPSIMRGNEWSNTIKPEKFVESLREVNSKNAGKLVPVIKLAKSIISSLPEQRQMTGYHVEALSVELFSNYTGETTPRAMLKHLFSEGSKLVLNSIKDKTGQTTHVDGYLGSDNSIERKMVSDSMKTMARKMQNADGSNDIRVWEEILK